MKIKNLLNDKRGLLAAALVTVCAALYIAYMITDIVTLQGKDSPTKYVKFTSIILCFMFTAINFAMFATEKDVGALCAGLFFTLLADLFMTALNFCYEASISFFICVQIAYLVRIYLLKDKKPYLAVGIRLGIIAVVLTVIGIMKITSPLIYIAGAYFPFLVCNAVEAFTLTKYGKKYLIFAIGLVLFVCCDICVGAHQVGVQGILEIPEGIMNAIYIGIWTFYLPAQVCISLSGINFEKQFAEQTEKA